MVGAKPPKEIQTIVDAINAKTGEGKDIFENNEKLALDALLGLDGSGSPGGKGDGPAGHEDAKDEFDVEDAPSPAEDPPKAEPTEQDMQKEADEKEAKFQDDFLKKHGEGPLEDDGKEVTNEDDPPKEEEEPDEPEDEPPPEAYEEVQPHPVDVDSMQGGEKPDTPWGKGDADPDPNKDGAADTSKPDTPWGKGEVDPDPNKDAASDTPKQDTPWGKGDVDPQPVDDGSGGAEEGPLPPNFGSSTGPGAMGPGALGGGAPGGGSGGSGGGGGGFPPIDPDDALDGILGGGMPKLDETGKPIKKNPKDSILAEIEKIKDLMKPGKPGG